MKRWFAAVAALSIVAALAGSAVRAPATVRGRSAAARKAFGKVHLAFEPNVGQADALVKFLAHSGGTTLDLTPTGAAHSMPEATPLGRPARLLPARPPSYLLGLAFAGSEPTASL